MSLRARAQSNSVRFLRRLFGLKAARAGASQSNSPLHKLTLRPTEVASPDGTGFRDVSFGHTHGAIVTGKGALFTYGSGQQSQLGHGVKEEWVELPKLVTGVDRVVQVACGRSHTLVLTESGEVYAFGKGDSFATTSAIGTKDRTDALAPRRVAVPDGVRIEQISAGSTHSLLRSSTGQVYAFGAGEYGRLGTGSSSAEKLPVLLQALQRHRIVQICTGSSFNGALDTDGNVYTCQYCVAYTTAGAKLARFLEQHSSFADCLPVSAAAPLLLCLFCSCAVCWSLCVRFFGVCVCPSLLFSFFCFLFFFCRAVVQGVVTRRVNWV